jgi:beta-lactamase superfamily II metal-dependent hydrolase
VIVPRATKRAAPAANVLRVRMYRVGFGDFFLLTVPSPDGPQHILIDCGVHIADIGSMSDCVANLCDVTQRKLALVIVTHNHADHLSGFASHDDVFSTFDVGAVWITNRLDPTDAEALKQRHRIAAIASDLSLQLRLRLSLELDEEAADVARQALAKVENALGTGFGVAGGVNAKALDVVTRKFRNAPPVRYYEAGDEPVLPASLQGAVTAEVLGPCPKALADEFGASDDKLAQYFAAAARGGASGAASFRPFERAWPATANDYWADAFRPWRTPAALEKALRSLKPDAEVAAADLIDRTLNNQSLVILFTCRRRKLLFVGDAQWGIWAYWLYGAPVGGKAPELSDHAREILASVDFYKVGHHGSTNATPIPVVGALPTNCAAMCSTETGYPSARRTYGNVLAKTEVPRTALMDALESRTHRKLVRSDWIAAGEAPASPEAKAELAQLPPHFAAGDNYIDYVFPD